MNDCYLPYDPEVKVNYTFILLLWQIADYNKDTKLFDTVQYNSINNLMQKLQSVCGKSFFSQSTLNRMIKDKKYSIFYKIDTINKRITLNNDFREKARQGRKFIFISSNEVKSLLAIGDSFIIRYFVYQKYTCNSSKIKLHNTTSKQILSCFGLSQNNGNNLSMISNANTVLSSNGLLHIDKFIDELGHERNKYSLL